MNTPHTVTSLAIARLAREWSDIKIVSLVSVRRTGAPKSFKAGLADEIVV